MTGTTRSSRTTTCHFDSLTTDTADRSRRAFLKRLAALAALVPVERPIVAKPTAGRIDVHHHYQSPAYAQFLSKHPAAGPPVHWTLEADLDDMDGSGTATAILSNFTPPTEGALDERRNLARANNEFVTRLIAGHPGRFGLFATIPLPDIDGCLRELEYALDILKADGVATYSNSGDRWLGDALFDPLWAELNRRKALVYVHPTPADCCRNLVPDVPDTIVEYGADTTRTIASLIFSGTTARHPDVRFIFAHGGGTMPFVVERFLGGTQAEIVPGVVTKGQSPPFTPKQPPNGALYELRKMHYDTAQCSNPVAMSALRKVDPVTQILYGTDYWFRTAGETARGLTTCGVFSVEELAAIDRGNAMRLLPRLSHPSV